MFKFIRISFFLVATIIGRILLFFSGGLGTFDHTYEVLSQIFIFDSLSFYFLILVIILGVYRQFLFVIDLDTSTRWFLLMSLVFSCFSFIINHSILFWCCYELSMLPLLYLIFKRSPYSERFLAGWYFCCYIVVTRLPLVLIIYYLRLIKKRFLFNLWSVSKCNLSILIILSFIFFTKIPLVPFHTWLPIVHAEATRIVSIFLRGYIMKLGLLGVYRCCYRIFNNDLAWYLLVTLTISVMFLITACTELDGKRWLAFLRLSHIVIPFFAFFIGDWLLIGYSFFYCLGHGLSAGLVFGLLWYMYELCGRRNWVLLKSGVRRRKIMFYTVLRLLSLCSFPPTIQFFCEVGLISCCHSLVFILFWSFYLFFGGLVPLILAGHSLIRCEFTENGYCRYIKFFNFFFFLCFWCYLSILLV